MASGKTSKTLVWVLMALLILGLGGFGVTNLSGSIRSIGSVGDKDISIDAYAHGLQAELRAIAAQTGQNMSFAEAQTLGFDRAVLARVIATRALDAETEALGISIGDARLRDEILAISAFRGLDGGFDREAYRFSLEQAGLSEAAFEQTIREEAARTLVQGAVVSGVQMPASFADTLMDFAAQRRDFTWAVIGEDLLDAPVADPSDAALMAYYEANIADFTRPGTKDITYASLTPEMILDSVEVDETALRALYDERSDQFNMPERRLVERLAFADAAAAEAARAALDSGEMSFEALVAERGLELSDADLGDVTAADLGAAAEAVFAVASGSVAGPAPSDLGPALFRVNAVLPAQATSFDEARAALREELAADRARRVIEAQIEDINDRLAGGATLEDLDQETDMALGQIAWHGDVSEGIAAYDAFRAAATTVRDGDFPEVLIFEDGGIFALRLDGVTPAAPAPFAEIRAEVETAWRAAETRAALEARAGQLQAQFEVGADFAALGLAPVEEAGQTRSGFVAGAPRQMLDAAFDMQPGDLRVVSDSARVVLVRLDAVMPPDPDSAETRALRTAIEDQLGSGLSQDLYEIYAADIQSRAGVLLDQQAINAVHAQFQ